MPDPDSTFRALGLPVAMCQGLQRAGKHTPFPIQQAAIPPVLSGRDCLLQAATGSGKTLAFGLPLVARIKELGPAIPGKPQGLIIAPTRDLALQLAEHLEDFARQLGLRVLCFVGGTKIAKQRTLLAAPANLVIATPGRLLDLQQRRWVDLRQVAIMACDEVDELAQLGFVADVNRIFKLASNAKQYIFTSATLDATVRTWVRKHMSDPLLIQVDSAGESSTVDAMARLTNMQAQQPKPTDHSEASHASAPGTTEGAPDASKQRHWRLQLDADDIPSILQQIESAPIKAVAFANSKVEIRELQRKLATHWVLHGDRSQAARQEVLGQFQQASRGMLLASDVAARGIDINRINLVVHIHPPYDAKSYVHRSGRTARAKASGDVLVLECGQEDQARTVQLLQSCGIQAQQLAISQLTQLLTPRPTLQHPTPTPAT
ncbi:MAG: DEAD/DEAH box helicase [Corynebacterium sp.]|nr:DEAD/DEAH box helicase [Corynebacterium sp.]